MSEKEAKIFFGIIGGIILIVVISKIIESARGKAGNLDYSFSRARITRKSEKTEKLLSFIAKQDEQVAPEKLRTVARNTFLQLQKCWEARDYAPMRPLMMPDLFREHESQIAGMIRNREINRIESLVVNAVDLANVRYTSKPENREFTALITATAKDYYVDDRTGVFIRGDTEHATFQEFWTFQLHDGRWLLRGIEQTRESDALKTENYFEAFTDKQVEQVYGEGVDKTGPIGPWLEESAADKATKIERMLNFLYETDKLWNRDVMLERARKIFTDVYMAREALALSGQLRSDLFPDIAEALASEIQQMISSGRTVQYRNFCVRKVEIVLVYNLRENDKDEFCVRINAHAQRILTIGGKTVRSDEDVTPFEEFWVFGRSHSQWNLKEVLPPARGRQATKMENLDEDSSPDQLQWYYSKERTV